MQGQLATETNFQTLAPNYTPLTADLLSTSSPIQMLSAGGYFSCSLFSDNATYCWGTNDAGELGPYSTVGESTPHPQSIGLGNITGPIQYITAGVYHACAVDFESNVWCWGDDQYGQLGPNGNISDPNPQPVNVELSNQIGATAVRTIVAGSSHSCALLSNNEVWCWGGNSWAPEPHPPLAQPRSR